MNMSRWPHLHEIAAGLFEARMSGVDFWDTDVGQRLLRGKRGAVPGQPGQPAQRGRSRPSRPRRAIALGGINEPEGPPHRGARPG